MDLLDILLGAKFGRGRGSGGSSSFIPSFGTIASVDLGTTWAGNDPYTSTVTVTGYTVTDKTMVSVLPSTAVLTQMLSDGTTNIFITNNNGVLTATAHGAAPTYAMTLTVLCTESDLAAEIGNLPGIVGDGVIETLQANDLTDAVNQLGGDVSDVKNAISAIEDKVLTDDIKDALLQIASKVAYVDSGGASYYNDLVNALYPPVSITAVYTQTDVITELSDLTALKSDLVVTAYRADQTYYVVSDSDYSLSGTLLEGTSTITVTYKGLTDDISVTVSPFVLTQQDLHVGCALTNAYKWQTHGYYDEYNIRTGYVEFDIPVKAGVTYIATVNWNNTYDLYCGIVTYTGDIYDLVAAHSNISTVTDTGWVHLSDTNGILEFTPTYDTVLRINSKIGSNGSTAFNSENTYFNSIKIGRKTGA